jgi:3-hydroxyisobutyrate dehydrogenase-like beta-hydroxyacid dehydrogenase
MGAAVGAALTQRGYAVQWLPAGRSGATRARASEANLVPAADLRSLAASSDVIVSVVPPEGATATAREVMSVGFAGLYVDANAIAPATSRAIAQMASEAGGEFVDGGIVGGPPRTRGETRLFLSGPSAGVVAGLFDESTFEAICLGDSYGAASAVKAAYAAYTKGGGALLLAVRAYARAQGVEAELLSEWARSQPGLEARSVDVARLHAPKAWRFSPELQEIAAAFDDAGIPDGFFSAAADVTGRLRAFKDADTVDPDQVLDALMPVDREGPTSATGERA